MKKQNTLVRMIIVIMLLAITVFGCSWLKRAKYEAQLGADIDGEAAYDESGWSVSLSADGSIVVIGAIGNVGAGIGAGYVQLGLGRGLLNRLFAQNLLAPQ
jgi:hypothetical protein